MKQRMKEMISTLRKKAKRTGFVRKAVGFGLAIMMVLEAPSWSGFIGSALAHEDKAGSGRCIYVDTSLIGVDSDVIESGIGAYVYNRDGSAYSDAPIIMEKVEGKRNVYQLVLDDYYTYVEFTKGSDLNTGTKTEAIAIDWSLGAPCYMFNSEELSDGGHFYGLYTVYFDMNGASDASAFTDNGVGVYAYNSEEDSYTAVPVAMKASDKGDGIYEYSFDRPYDCIAFMGGYGSWNYEVATTPVYMEWSYSAPCFFLEQVDGYESTGLWRNLRYTVYFDASDIKEDEAFIENGVWLYAFNDSDDKLSENPVKMVASSAGSDIYEYTMERPYENLQFILGDSLDAEVSSQVLVNDWLTYAEPCYKMTLDRKEILMASPSPSMTPSASPSGSPSATPSMDPSASPSGSPSTTPSMNPSGSPSTTPSTTPSVSPSGNPSATPSIKPSTSPSAEPSATPSANPTVTPTANPTEAPTTEPTEIPTIKPTEEPTAEPTQEPVPTEEPTAEPIEPSEPEEEPTPEPIEDSTDDQQNDTAADDSEPEEQVSEQARIAVGNMTVTYGSYKMAWVGTEGETEVDPDTVDTEEEESEDTDDVDDTNNTDEPTTPDGTPVTGDESTDSQPSAGVEEPAATNAPANNPDENPVPTGIEEGEPAPSDDLGMADATPSALPEGIEDEPVVETSMSLLSSTGATMMFQKAAALPRSNDGVTIYFDTSGNGSWTTGDAYGWNKGDNMYVYFYNASGDKLPSNGLLAMTKTELPAKEADGVIWAYTLTKAQAEKYTYVIFQRHQASWNDDNQQTTSDNAINTIPFNMSRPCFMLSSSNTNPAKKTGSWYDMGPLSQSGEVINFFDMTSQHKEVEARFAGNGNTDVAVDMDEARGGYPIPGDTIFGPYSTVAFYDKTTGLQIGETYSFFNDPDEGKNEKGFLYDSEQCNTFYYGATEKADGTIISSWGAKPSVDVVSLEGKKLYFDKLYFKVSKTTDAGTGTGSTGDAGGTDNLEAQLQIGEELPLIPLTADAGDARTYSYTFTGTAATSQTILTYIDQDGTKYHFFWDKFDLDEGGSIIAGGNNLVTLEDEIAKVMGKYELGNWIYFDATMSKMPSEIANTQIPKEDDVVYCLMAKSSSGQEARTLEMEKVKDRGTWTNVWRIDVPDGYTYVKFANYKISMSDGRYANGTDMLKVPADVFDPCFYANAGDSDIYGNNWRGGYWDEVYTIRDPEEIKDTAVVDIATSDYTKNSNRLYVSTTLYDYYTDYELNGNNRDSYTGFANNSHRDWVTFRQFDQALSDYYEEAGEPIPIYTGHFQPNIGGAEFRQVADYLDLYGYDNYGSFFSTNNSGINISGNGVSSYANVAQGLVASELKDGQIYASGNQVALPHFNEDFLGGNNSKNAVVGRVYEDVAFPFELKENYHSDEPGVSYWVYDSNDKSLEMKQTSDGEYYLYEDESSPKKWWSKNRDSKGTELSNYGFFPFNSGISRGDARAYNYGYGARIEIKFRLTEDGKVEMAGDGDQKADIKFDFSGDDDVWVFIDGHLALDMGGSHAASHGYLNFANRTAYVDNVKPSAGSSNGPGAVTSSFTVDGYANGKYDTREHTLTMFYMERGMWESNMKISFNFPDENQLEVEKRVNMEAVNDIFRSAFDGQKIFEFSIRNLATHFGTTPVVDDDNVPDPIPFNPDFSGIYATASANTFRPVSEHAGHTNVAYWLAQQNDASSSYKHLRYGVIPGSAAAGGMKYLQFSYYYAGTGTPSLSRMYLRIETSGGTAVNKLSGRVYGSASMKRNEWGTITVDLDKFFAGYAVNRNEITSVSFGYDYPEPFYLDDFVFKTESKSMKLTGFITKQPDIPDYGTAYDPVLKIPKGAMFTRKLEGTEDTYGRIDESGTFALEDGESVLFRDQFRRGSYIELKELQTSAAFSTTWTMYENGQPVVGMNGSSGVKSVIVADTGRSLKDQHNEQNAVEDGRTERYTNDPKDGVNQGNSYNEGNKPGDPVFVFRSYSDPDSDAGVTKLKVVYTNTVNVGNLVISKSQAEGSQDLISEYQFRVTFTNIAGMGLEGDNPIVVDFKLPKGGSKEISGIPLGTDFVIEELQPADKSFLTDVTGPAASDDFIYDIENRQVRGKITAAGETLTYDFSNMLKPVINVEVTKVWLDASGNEIEEPDGYMPGGTLPESLTIRIQRRIKGTDSEWETVEKYKDDVELGVGYERSWEYIFADLEKYVDNTDTSKGMYEYRVVEVDDAGKIILNGGFFGSFQASYKGQINSGKPEDIPGETESYPCTITNLHTVSLKVKKVDASGNPLGGVTFKLEKKNGDSWEAVKVIVNGVETDTITTPTEEENPAGGAGIVIFSNLPKGEYQLTEVATAPGHTLLKDPIPITVNADGNFTYTINGKEQTPVDNTLELTIKNGQNLVMPATGGAGPIPFTVGGLSICMIASLMYIDSMRKRRKEGKAS